ncbi:hypothetical protein J4231_01660 [Candidatus Woesearchaeota archaeon]|nr:hypothetical protein [Candidatus Woesearchaeota archaeon]
MASTPLGNAIDFLNRFGFFDVVLPFLTVFTIVFAILEKTRILGVDEKKKPKANINSMVAFTIALFFIAIPQVVDAIKTSLPYVGILLIIIVAYMLLVGSYASGEKEFNFENSKFWKGFMGIVIFVGLLVVFLNSFGWLDSVFDYIRDNWQNTFIVSVIFTLAIIGTLFWVVREKEAGKS